MIGNIDSVSRKIEPWFYLAITVAAFAIIAVTMVTDYQTRQETEAEVPSHVLMTEQEYTVSELLDTQATETMYLLRKDGALAVWNVRLSQTENGNNILTGVSYRSDQLVLIASHESNGETLREQMMGKEKYPNVPAEISYSLFRRYGELETNAWAMELTLPKETETITLYSNG